MEKENTPFPRTGHKPGKYLITSTRPLALAMAMAAAEEFAPLRSNFQIPFSTSVDLPQTSGSKTAADERLVTHDDIATPVPAPLAAQEKDAASLHS